MGNTTNNLLATPAGIQWIKEMRRDSVGIKRRKLQLMLESAVLEYWRNCTSNLDYELESELKKPVFDNHMLKDIPFLISKEPDQKQRELLEDVYGQYTFRLGDLYWAKLEYLQQAALTTGYKGYMDMLWDVWDIDGPLFLRESELVIQTFKSQYREVLNYLYKQINNSSVDMSYRDWLFLRNYLIESSMANPIDTMQIISECILFFGLKAPNHLIITNNSLRGSSEWDAKNSAGIIAIPNDDPIYILPILLHETGHVAEGIYRSQELEDEFLGSIDLSLSEAWAFIFESRCHMKDWLKKINICQKPEYLSKAYSIWSAYWVRRYAANVLYVNSLFENGIEATKEFPTRMLTATGLSHDHRGALTEMDELWRDIAYLRGYSLARLVIKKLRDEHLRLKLIDLCKMGPKISLETFAANLGENRFSIILAGEFGIEEN